MSSYSSFYYNSPYFIIDRELNIIVELLSGSYDFRKLSALRRLEMNHPQFNIGFDIVTDIRNATLDISTTDILNYDFQMESITLGNQQNKMAILADSPKETALSFMLLKQIKRDDFNGGVFSTNKGVLDWLGFNEGYQRFRILEHFNLLKSKHLDYQTQKVTF